MNTLRSKNYNWMVSEAKINFDRLNKIKRAEVTSFEDKTLITIQLNKMNAKEIWNELKKYS